MPNRTENIRTSQELIADGLKPKVAKAPAGWVAYGRWWITYDPPPIPYRGADWHFWHDDYDGAEDSNDRRCGHAASLEAAKAEIDAFEEEERAA